MTLLVTSVSNGAQRIVAGELVGPNMRPMRIEEADEKDSWQARQRRLIAFLI
jgi:hypothetical protein